MTTQTKTKLGKTPCDGCHACCHDVVILEPKEGDDLSLYRTKTTISPQTGAPITVLEQKPGGACIYLEEGKCTIYHMRPRACQVFDCRLIPWQFARFGGKDISRTSKMVKDLPAWNRKTVEQGNKLYHTLDATETEKALYKNNIAFYQTKKVK